MMNKAEYKNIVKQIQNIEEYTAAMKKKLKTLSGWWEISKEARMAKYWAANEMADEICCEDGVQKELVECDTPYELTFWGDNYAVYLEQLLKKEWFR